MGYGGVRQLRRPRVAPNLPELKYHRNVLLIMVQCSLLFRDRIDCSRVLPRVLVTAFQALGILLFSLAIFSLIWVRRLPALYIMIALTCRGPPSPRKSFLHTYTPLERACFHLHAFL